MRSLPTFPIQSLMVRPLVDPVVEQMGFDARSAYVERFWLGILGPSATWLLRRLVDGLETSPGGYALDLPTVAAELGLGTRSGQHSPFVRTIERCARFGAVELRGTTELRVRRALPPLTRFQLERLPSNLRAEHDTWLEAPPHATPAEHRERARGLALSLLDGGQPAEVAEQLLHARAVHPALAHEAVAWAVERHEVTRRVPTSDLPPEAA